MLLQVEVIIVVILDMLLLLLLLLFVVAVAAAIPCEKAILREELFCYVFHAAEAGTFSPSDELPGLTPFTVVLWLRTSPAFEA